MRHYLLLASTAVLLVACNHPANNTANDVSNAAPGADSSAMSAASDATASASAAASAPAATPSTPDFVNAAASTDMFEIQAAKLAERRSKNPDVKAFAAMMIHDHTKSTAELKAAIKASGVAVTPPSDLGGDMKAKLDALTAASDADFDKAYIASQVSAHQTALGVMQAYAANGDTPQIKAFAAKTATVVQMHLDKATSIQSSLH